MKNRRKRSLACFTVHPSRALALLAVVAIEAHADESGRATQVAQVQFNEQFLAHSGQVIDLSRYSRGNPVMPGAYRADLYVNEAWLGRAQVVLRQVGSGTNNVVVCFDRELLERVGVDAQKLSPAANAMLDGAPGTDGRGSSKTPACVALEQLVPDATASFDIGEQRLNVSVPQVSLRRSARGYVDPRYWDDGVPAALLQYNANFFRSSSQGATFSQGYLGLTAGLNFGPWRLRHSGNLSSANSTGTRYQGVQTTLQRSIESLRSQLVIGDGFTSGSLFDSFGFRGIQLSTDDRMLPESQRGFAPRVTGIARSNAVVRIKQNGNIIYQTNVAPGAFSIDDLYPTGYGGNLDVEVTESDGSVHVSSVPYAAAVNALRPGITRYSATVGRYRDTQVSDTPMVAQATVQHGLNNTLTGYGGLTVAQGYASGLIGAAVNTEWGAIGLDAQQSTARILRSGTRSGQSVRLSYTKRIAPTDTNISVAAFRYSSSGYLSLRDAMTLRDDGDRMGGMGGRRGFARDSFLQNGPMRGRLQLSINQQLPRDWGSLYVSGSTQDYWNRDGRDTQFQLGYNTRVGRVNVGLSVSRQFDARFKRWGNVAMITLGIPLEIGSRQVYASTNLQSDMNGRSSVQQAVTGSAGEDSAFNYGLNATQANGDRAGARASAGANLSYASPMAALTASASGGPQSSQFSAGVSGGVVAYEGGVMLTPIMGDTTAVVEADKAAGARVLNGSGLRVDRWGHAVVPNLVPFSRNEIELDPKGLPLSVELKTSMQHVAPTAGAVVRLKFETAGGGRAVLVRAMLADGTPAPFGAQAFDAAGQSVGVVAQFGQLLLRGVEPGRNAYLLKWGEGAAERCRLAITPASQPEAGAGHALTTMDALCSAIGPKD